jgi:hypothetical protein
MKHIDELYNTVLEEFMQEYKYATVSVPQNLKEQFARALIEQCAKVAEEWYLQAESLHWDVGQHIRNHFWIQE